MVVKYYVVNRLSIENIVVNRLEIGCNMLICCLDISNIPRKGEAPGSSKADVSTERFPERKGSRKRKVPGNQARKGFRKGLLINPKVIINY